MNVIRYNDKLKHDWDHFVKLAKNGHFMFYRDYMDYHADRFSDYSLVFYDEKNRILAVLPANYHDGKIYTHQGLTFGGMVVSNKITTSQVCVLFNILISFLKETDNINTLVYKRIPDFYCLLPSQEDLYAINLLGSILIRRDVGSLIDLQASYSYSKGRKWSINKAKKTSIEIVEESEDFSSFWYLLNDVLKAHHAANPVHSIDEIHTLRTIFPKNIKCFTARLEGRLLAGAVIYETENVAHTQYLANSDEGRELGALDFLIDHLLKNTYKDKRYFDFGISTENNGTYLNEGLIAQKEGFGARAVVQDSYEIKIK